MCSNYCFLAKAASHKLYCNYRSADDVYHLGHLGHMWSSPSTFKLPVRGQIHTHLSPTSLHPPRPFIVAHVVSFSFSFFFFCVVLVNNIQVLTGAGRTSNLLLSVLKRCAFHGSFQAHSGSPDSVWGNVAHWELLQLSLLLHRDTRTPF